MSRPIDVVLDRLAQYRVRPHGRDRWRACCPAHGGTNPSALSIGIGNDDAVLLRCWSGCEVHEIAQALGLELHDLFPPKPQGHATPKPRRIGMLTTGQALDLIRAECNLIWVAAHNLAAGHALAPADLQRLSTAANRVENLIMESQQ